MLATAVVMQIGAQAVVAGLGRRAVFSLGSALMALGLIPMRPVLRPTPRHGTGGGLLQAFAAMRRLLRRPRLSAVHLSTVALMSAFVTLYTAMVIVGSGLSMSFHQWRTLLQIQRALLELSEGPSVTDTAVRLGWANPGSFISAFTGLVGQTTPGPLPFRGGCSPQLNSALGHPTSVARLLAWRHGPLPSRSRHCGFGHHRDGVLRSHTG
ncbi:hypothetical protein [Streptomyces sp. NPDC059906]|uniref:hypothetical protein n=1 Tax=Streptomyces sp. NPDC059906 TaxID=3346997 RepID=UPI00364B1054